MLGCIGTQGFAVYFCTPWHLDLSGGLGLDRNSIHQRSSIEWRTSSCTWIPLELTLLTSTGDNCTSEERLGGLILALFAGEFVYNSRAIID